MAVVLLRHLDYSLFTSDLYFVSASFSDHNPCVALKACSINTAVVVFAGSGQWSFVAFSFSLSETTVLEVKSVNVALVLPLSQFANF